MSPSRLFVATGIAVTLVSTTPRPTSAQLRSVGIQAGASRSREIRDRNPDSGSRTGALFGVYLDAQAPPPWLGVLSELSYVQRGGAYDLALPVPAGVSGLVHEQIRVEYLAFTVAPTLSAPMGPVSLLGYAGPSLAVLIRTRSGVDLRSLYRQQSDQVFAVAAGAGVEVRTGTGWTLRGELRLSRDVSAAFSDDTGDYRHASTEVVFRLGKHPLP
jgi:hypothetical protein